MNIKPKGKRFNRGVANRNERASTPIRLNCTTSTLNNSAETEPPTSPIAGRYTAVSSSRPLLKEKTGKGEAEMSIEDQILLAENDFYLYAMEEHHCKDDLNEEIKGLDERIKKEQLEVGKKKKLLQEQIKKVKAIQLVKQRHDILTAAAKKLENVPCVIEPEFTNKIKHVLNDQIHLISSLTLNNFSPISESEADEMVNDFKDLSNIMAKIEEYIKSIKTDETSSHLSKLVEKLNDIHIIVEKLHAEEMKVNDLMSTYMTLKLGAHSEKKKDNFVFSF